MAKILFVVTGARHWTLTDGTQHPTGYWAEELLAPYEAFTQAGHTVVFATPSGATPVPDRGSLAPELNDGRTDVESALTAIAGLASPQDLAKVDVADYDAVFYPGGHGPMEDLAVDADSGRVLTETLDSGKPLAVVCHGPAALLAAQRPDGTSPFAGYRVTGFTNAEETQAGLAEKAPWLLQDRLTALGTTFDEGPAWEPHVVADRNLYTGQNPASAAPLAAEVLTHLS